MSAVEQLDIVDVVDRINALRKPSHNFFDSSFIFSKKELTQSQVVSYLVSSHSLFNGELHRFVSQTHDNRPLALTRLLSELGMLESLYQHSVLLSAMFEEVDRGNGDNKIQALFDEYETKLKRMSGPELLGNVRVDQEDGAIMRGSFIKSTYQSDELGLDPGIILKEMVSYFAMGIELSWAVNVGSDNLVAGSDKFMVVSLTDSDLEDVEMVNRHQLDVHSKEVGDKMDRRTHIDLEATYMEALVKSGVKPLLSKFVNLVDGVFNEYIKIRSVGTTN